MVVDISVDRGADRRSLHQPVADGEAAERAREVDPQARELHPRRGPAGLLRSGGDAVERGLAAHREVANIEDAFLRRQIGALRIERDPHLAADDLGIDVVEAEEGAGVVGLDEDGRVGRHCRVRARRR